MQSNLLDLAVARALMHWRLVERALHERGPWTMRYVGVEVGVSRFIRADRVSFVAHFPPLCPLEEPEPRLLLCCNGEVQRVLDLDKPLDEDGCQVWIDLSLGVAAQVS